MNVLADIPGGSEVWVIIIMAIVSAIGALVKKSQNKEPKPGKIGTVARPPGPRAMPAKPRPRAEPPALPHITRSQKPIPRAEPISQRPPLRVRPRPARPIPPALEELSALISVLPERITPTRPAAPQAPQLSAPPVEVAPKARPGPPVRRAGMPGLDEALRTRGGTELGIVLAEILGPPLALRQGGEADPWAE